MAGVKRCSTGYPGVFYREVARLDKQGTERVYYIVFKKDGKVVEEKVGRQYADNMTPAKANIIRSERITGKRRSRQEIILDTQAVAADEHREATIGQIWAEYQVLRSAKKSLATDKYNYNNHLKKFSPMRPGELTTLAVQRLRHSLEKKGLSPASVKHMLVLLRMLINWGSRNGMCSPIDPMRLRFDLPKVDNQRTETLNPEQLAAYMKALDAEPDQNIAALFRLALATGMRKSALLNLRWDDCDFEHSLIVLRGEVAKKGKTEWIPMSNVAHAVLKQIDRTDSPYVFPGRDGRPRKEIRSIAVRLREQAGLPKNFRPLHALRHAYASMLVSSGQVDLYTLQRLLTHSDVKMTQRYAHLADSALRRAANVSDAILQDAHPGFPGDKTSDGEA